jgi:hypothetical protein
MRSEPIACEMTLHSAVITDPDILLATLRIRAREIDEENGADPPESYTLAQAIQVCFHSDPEWLLGQFGGWTIDKVDTGEGMQAVWS